MKYRITKDSGQSIVASASDMLILARIQRAKGHTIAQADMAGWLATGRIMRPVRMGNITIEEVDDE